MKKILLAIAFACSIAPAYAAQNYSTGNLLLGIALGAGTPSVLPIGAPQFTLNPSVELIVGTWNTFALGVTIDSTFNIGGSGTGITGSIAPMLTGHITILPRWDWFVSLGMGLQLLSASGITGIYNILVGFNTGFNVVITPAVIFTVGMGIHAKQFFGSTGVKIRFGDASKIQYNRRR